MLAKVNQVRGVLPRTIHGLIEEIGAFVAMGRYSLREGQQVIQKKNHQNRYMCNSHIH